MRPAGRILVAMSSADNHMHLYMERPVRELARKLATRRGHRYLGAYIRTLIEADAAAAADEDRVSLLEQAKAAPDATRARILAALVVTDGNAARARALLQSEDADWRRAVALLTLGPEIARLYPARRAIQRKEADDGPSVAESDATAENG